MSVSNYLAPHWPKFNGKYPEDMTFEEINEYIAKDDFLSVKKIILYSRGYLPISELSKALVEKNAIETINILLEFLPESVRDILSYSIFANSLEIVKHITKNYKNCIYKNNILQTTLVLNHTGGQSLTN